MHEQDNFEKMVIALGKVGVSVNEAIEGIQRLNQALNDLLRPVSDAKPENPNPKVDLENFEQIRVSKIEPLNELSDWYLEML